MTKPAIKITATLGSLILLAGALLQLGAVKYAKRAMANEPANSFFQAEWVVLWILPFSHYIFIAALSVGLSRYKSKACAAVLMGFGALILVDALILLTHIGLYIGTYMIALAGALLLTCGVMLRKEARAG